MEILGNRTSVRILEALFENPIKSFKETELIQTAKTGKGSAATAINKLIKGNILLEERAGKTKNISLNFRSEAVFLLKNLFDQKKLSLFPRNKLAAMLLFKQQTRQKVRLMAAFGSCAAGTATKESDIDILVVASEDISKERAKAEELFGERINLHSYTEESINITDSFVQNAFLQGVLLCGYDFGRELFSELKKKEGTERLFFLKERIDSSLRNYLKGDTQTAKEILDKTLEQLAFYIIHEQKGSFKSKKEAMESIKMPEAGIIKKINKAAPKEKISLTENFILDMLAKKILEEEGITLYVKREDIDH